MSEINTSRYVEEFHQVAKLGDGEFGSVYRCVNRLDGCTYAIKKSKMPVAGSVYEYVQTDTWILFDFRCILVTRAVQCSSKINLE